MPLDPRVAALDPVLSGQASQSENQEEPQNAAPSTPPVSSQGLDPRVAALDPVLGGISYQSDVPSVVTPDMKADADNAKSINYFARKFKLGMGQISQSVAGWQLATSDDFSAQQAQEQVNTDDMLKLQQSDEEYASGHAMFRIGSLQVTPNDFLGGWVAQALPSLGAMGAGAAYGAAAGAVFGGLPGAGIGALWGSAMAAGVMGAGNTMYDLSQRGVDKNTARVGALFSGVGQAAAAMIGPGAAVAGVGGAANAIMREQVVNTAMHVAKSIGYPLAATEAATIADTAIRYVATRTSNGAKPYSEQEAMDDFNQASVQALVTIPQMVGGMHVIGAGAGTIAKHVQRTIDANAEIHAQKNAAEQAAKAEQDTAVLAQLRGETNENIALQKAKTKKTLQGFATVTESASVEEAQAAYEQAKDAHDAAHADGSVATKTEKAQTIVDKVNAENALQEARYQAKIENINDVLTQPDLNKVAKERLKDLQDQIKEHKDKAKEFANAAEKAVTEDEANELMDKSRAESSKAFALYKTREEMNAQAKLSGDELREKLEAQKARVQKKVDDIRLKIAKEKVVQRMAKRQYQISELRRVVKANEQKNKPVEKETHQLEGMIADQETDKLIKELYDQGVIDYKDENLLGSKIAVRRLEGVVKIAKQQIENAAKAGSKSQRDTINSIKTLLNAVVDSSRLPKADRNAIKAKLDVQNLNELTKQLPILEDTITELVEKRKKQAAVSILEGLLDKINPKSSAASTRPGVEEFLTAIKNFSLDREAIERFKIEATQSDIDKAKQDLTQLFEDYDPNKKGLKRFSAETLEKIIDAVIELNEHGKTEALRRHFELEAKRDSVKERVLNRMLVSPKGKVMGAEDTAPGGVRLIQLNPIKSIWGGWDRLMYTITQNGTLDAFHDIPELNLKKMTSAAWGFNDFWRTRFKQIVDKHGLTNKQYAKALRDGWQNAPVLEYRKLDRSKGFLVSDKKAAFKGNKHFTNMELVQFYNWLRDTDLNAVNRLKGGNGFTYPETVYRGTSTLEVIERYLSENYPDMLKLADALREFYSPDEFGKVVDEAAYRRFGRHITPNETYGGRLTGETSILDTLQGEFKRSSLKPSPIMERTGTMEPVEARDAMDLLDSHIQMFARDSAFYNFEQVAPHVFGDDTIKRFISRNFGDTTSKVLDKYITDIIKQPEEQEGIISKFLNAVRRKHFTYSLGARPDQFIKQLTGIVHALQVSSPKEVFEGYAYFMANPEKSIEMMNQSPLLRNRQQLIDQDFKVMTNRMERANNLTMKAVEAGDALAVWGSSFPALLAELKKTGSMPKALEAFERAFETTQGSMSIENTAHIYRSGAMMKLLTIFSKQANMQVEMISNDFDNFVNNPTKAGFGKVVNTTAISFAGALLYPLAGWLFSAPFQDPEKAEQRLEEILGAAPLGPYSSMPIVGLALTPTLIDLENMAFGLKMRAFEARSLELSIIDDINKTFHGVLDTLAGKEEDAWKSIMYFAKSVGHATGFPVPSILKGVEPVVGEDK